MIGRRAKGGGKARSGASRKADDSTSEEPLSEESADLFERLRALRKELADRRGVPAYVIFNDRTLKAIAEERPDSPAELLSISGVGPAKLERYGEAFLEAIR
jgi:ATP-dependent DNA helicase RecQ